MANQVHLIESTASPTIALTDGLLTITDTYNNTFMGVRLENLGKVTKQAAVAETANVRTGTITRAASTSYKIAIARTFTDSGIKAPSKMFTYSHTSSAGAASDGTICQAFVDMINADSANGVVAAKTGDTTFTVTTDAGSPIMTISNVGTGTIAFANTTPGVVARNTYALLDAAGVEGLESGSTYVSYTAKVEVERGGKKEVDNFVLYVEDSLTTEVGEIDDILTGTGLDDTTATTLMNTLAPYITKQ